MPTPKSDETQDTYLTRCMGDAEMNSKYPDEKQRLAVCNAYWGNYQSHVGKPGDGDEEEDDQ